MKDIKNSLMSQDVELGTHTLEKNTEFLIPFPEKCNTKDVSIVTRDFELLHEIAQTNSKDFEELILAAREGNKRKATTICRKLKLTEDDFINQGGGWIGVVLVAAVLLYSHEAH